MLRLSLPVQQLEDIGTGSSVLPPAAVEHALYGKFVHAN